MFRVISKRRALLFPALRKRAGGVDHFLKEEKFYDTVSENGKQVDEKLGKEAISEI